MLLLARPWPAAVAATAISERSHSLAVAAAAIVTWSRRCAIKANPEMRSVDQVNDDGKVGTVDVNDGNLVRGGASPPNVRRRAWTADEDRALRRAMQAAAGGDATASCNWTAIAEAVSAARSDSPGVARSGPACRQRWLHSLRDGRRSGRFSPAEDGALLALARQRAGKRDYVGLAQALDTGRPAPAVRERLLVRLDPTIRWTRFSPHEDEALRKTVAAHGHDWALAARCLPGRTRQQCLHRWFALMPGKVFGEWTPDEDTRLLEIHAQLVGRHGIENVSFGDVAVMMGSRNRKQCYARYQRLLARPKQTSPVTKTSQLPMN
jgi:hypothetical protein